MVQVFLTPRTVTHTLNQNLSAAFLMKDFIYIQTRRIILVSVSWDAEGLRNIDVYSNINTGKVMANESFAF